MNARLTSLFILVLFANLTAFAAPQIIGWGYNLYGQTTIPAGLTNVQAVAAGRHHSLALKNDGTVVAWGYNNYGQTNVPAGLANVASIKAGDWFSMALTANGKVVVWGDHLLGETNVPAGLSNVVAIAAGSADCMALKQDGTVVTWGSGSGYSITPPANLSGVKAIAAGWAHCLALKTDGTIVGWGDNEYGQTNTPSGSFSSIAAGNIHSLAVRTDGTVVAWGGQNQYGEITIPSNLNNVAAVAAGDYWSIALKKDGTLVGWGLNNAGQTTPPNTVTNIGMISAECSSEFCLALTRNVDVSLQVYAGVMLNGLVGSSYHIDYADTLTGSWYSLTNIILPTSPFLFIDTSSPGKSQRFYRVTPTP